MALTLEACLDLIPNEFRRRLHHKLEEGGSLAKIARSIRDWKIAAHFLPGIEDQDIAAIEHDQSLSLDLQKYVSVYIYNELQLAVFVWPDSWAIASTTFQELIFS